MIYFHKFIGIMLIIAYLVVLIRLEVFFPGLSNAFSSGYIQLVTGAMFVVLLPVISIACFLFATKLAEFYVPKMSIIGDRLTSESYYFIVGYMTFCFVIALYAIFI